MKPIPLSAAFTLLSAIAFAVNPDANSLTGIHWYPNTDALTVGQDTDVEAMTDNHSAWVLEITHLDASQAPAWDQPGYFVGHSQKVDANGHSLVYRVQPYWSRNVPHASDPYTLANFAADAQSAANTLKDYVHIWQIGNEVNIRDENKRWNSGTSAYDTNWEPTPADYAATYVALRDAIHNVTPTAPLSGQIVLMQPVSPGGADTYRYMDGNEFLYRMIDAVADKSKIDGFALHSYAEPGGSNFGVDGFWDCITEQLAIIESFGLGDRPIYITEFNKHMPNATEANIGAKFLHRAYARMNSWNTSNGGLWPGQPNHNIRAATWFVYPATTWTDYSLGYWKTQIVSTDHELNPWYSFRYAAQQNYPAGAIGGGATVADDQLWWSDDFSTLDTAGGPPDWFVETTGTGSAVAGTGAVRLLGNSSSTGGATLRTRGYAYSDFRAEIEFTVVNGAMAQAAAAESNFDIRIREGSLGYSLTFYTSGSTQRPSQVWLRRTSNWSENIGGFNAAIPGGINNGDTFLVEIVADGTTIKYDIYKNGAPTPVASWTVNDSGQRVGYIRMGTYNMQEAQVNEFRLGGKEWSGNLAPTGVRNWMMW